jgi:hypothetical protein
VPSAPTSALAGVAWYDDDVVVVVVVDEGQWILPKTLTCIQARRIDRIVRVDSSTYTSIIGVSMGNPEIADQLSSECEPELAMFAVKRARGREFNPLVPYFASDFARINLMRSSVRKSRLWPRGSFHTSLTPLGMQAPMVNPQMES